MKNFFIFVFAFPLMVSLVFAQMETRVGALWKSVDPKGVWSSGTYVWQNRETEWPVGFLQDWKAPDGMIIQGYVSNAIAQPHLTHSWGEGYWIGLKNWTSPTPWVDNKDEDHNPGTHYEVFVTKYGPDNPKTSVHIPVKKSLKKYIRQTPPGVFVDGQKVIPTATEKYDLVKSDLVSDEFIEVAWNHSVGLSCVKKVYSYANRDHDDYAIIDITIKNTGVWDANIGKSFTPDTLHDLWWGLAVRLRPDVQKKGQDAPCDVVGGDPLYDYDPVNRVMYAWDGHDVNQGDDWNQWELHPGDGAYEVEFIAPTFLGIGVLHADSAYNDESDRTSQPASVFVPDWKVETDGEFYDSLSCGHHFRSDRTKTPGDRLVVLGFGPYELPPGEDLRFVYTWACGARSQSECIEMGWKYKHDEVTRAEVDTFMWAGRDSLIQNVANAKWAFEHNYDIPDPPPAPDNFIVESGFGEVFLSWDDVSKAVEYRLYRATGLVNPSEPSIYGVYKEVYRGVEPSVSDTSITPGFSYYYYVTAVDQDGLESNVHYNRMPTKSPAQPGIPGLETLDRVRVVPNPYNIKGGEYDPDSPHGDTGFNWKGRSEDLLFVNLPKDRCTIKVFNVKGDLVKTFKKIEGPDRLVWENILTSWNQYIVSGIYFYVVESPGHKTYKDKFVVIR